MSKMKEFKERQELYFDLGLKSSLIDLAAFYAGWELQRRRREDLLRGYDEMCKAFEEYKKSLPLYIRFKSWFKKKTGTF